MTKRIEYVNVIPTWSGLLPTLLVLVTEGNPEGQKVAREELARMAKAADLAVAQQARQRKPKATKWTATP